VLFHAGLFSAKVTIFFEERAPPPQTPSGSGAKAAISIQNRPFPEKKKSKSKKRLHSIAEFLYLQME
jgi:hypothetical protein